MNSLKDKPYWPSPFSQIGNGDQKQTRLNGLGQAPLGRSLAFRCTCQKRSEYNACSTGLTDVRQNISEQQDEISCQDS